MVKILQVLIKQSDSFGGIESYLENVYFQLNHEKYGFDWLFINKKAQQREKQINSYGGRMYHIPIQKYNKITKILKYYYAAYKFCKENEYDVVHINDGNPLFIFIIAIAVKTSRSKAKIVAHAHSAMYPSVMKRTMAYASSIARKLMYFFVDEYIACSDLAAKYAFPNKIYVNKRYRIINNGIETDKFVFNSDKRQNVREKLCVDDNTLVVGHIGRFSNEKNHSFLIDVFNQILKININAVLILIGSGYLKENIENKAIKLGIVDKIIFIGAAKQQDVIGYYQAMDVFVLPSLYEGFPVVGVEAQVAGVPMVVSDTITKEMDFTGNVIYLSLKEEVSLWADKIIKMACVERKSYDSEAICRGFDVKCTAKSLMEFYDEIIL